MFALDLFPRCGDVINIINQHRKVLLLPAFEGRISFGHASQKLTWHLLGNYYSVDDERKPLRNALKMSSVFYNSFYPIDPIVHVRSSKRWYVWVSVIVRWIQLFGTDCILLYMHILNQEGNARFGFFMNMLELLLPSFLGKDSPSMTCPDHDTGNFIVM